MADLEQSVLMAFNKLIEHCRTELEKLSVVRVANKIGVSQATLYYFKAGRVPEFRTLLLIARFLDAREARLSDPDFYPEVSTIPKRYSVQLAAETPKPFVRDELMPDAPWEE